jgi:hypothetical protein
MFIRTGVKARRIIESVGDLVKKRNFFRTAMRHCRVEPFKAVIFGSNAQVLAAENQSVHHHDGFTKLYSWIKFHF